MQNRLPDHRKNALVYVSPYSDFMLDSWSEIDGRRSKTKVRELKSRQIKVQKNKKHDNFLF